MDSLRFIFRSAWHYRRPQLGLLLGTMLCAAILSGALSVGDSVDHTLRTFAAQRLGSAGLAVTSGDKLFAAHLGDALGQKLGAPTATLLALPGMAIHVDNATTQRTQVNKVQALGVTPAFWDFGAVPGPELGRREAALGQRLAESLGAKVGDSVALRISKPGLLSRDAPLSSREDDTSVRANFTVKAIVTDDGMGRFGLAPSQLPPNNFFVSLSDLQQLAEVEDQANLMLVARGSAQETLEAALEAVWTPADAGISITERLPGTLQLESKRIFLDEATEQAAMKLPGASGALTYLVNGLSLEEKSTPYSFMTAGGALTTGLGDDEIVINQWLADALQAQPGARVTVKFYEVLPSNKFEERTRDFTVKFVLPMETFATEKALVPTFPGLSNVESCADWKIGMPMDEALLKDTANEAYWKAHRETPKALVTLAAGQAMWGNRFGRLTAVRFAGDAGQIPTLMSGLAAQTGPREAGFEVRDVGAAATAAVDQAMDLGGLFLGMSFFLLISALVLTGLLYAFGAQRRAAEFGTLTALGFTRGRVLRLLLLEAALVATPGALLGAFLGLGYAWALMIGLANYWQAAVGRIPIIFHATPASMAIAVFATLICALVTAWVTVRRLLRHSANELMHADFTQAFEARPAGRWARWGAWGMAACTALTVGYALVAPPANPAELFFTAGSFALLAGLALAWRALSPTARTAQAPTMPMLARMNTTRRRARSLGIVSSLAAGGFLVLAVSVMQADLHANADKRWAGTGGYALYGETTVPILDPALLGKAAPGVAPVALRVFDGDDASCLNLNHATRPRVVGVDTQAFTASKAFVEGSDEGLWQLLDAELPNGEVPALVGDSDTAMWTLKKKTGPEGDVLTYRDEAGRDVPVRLVGKLPMRLSVFQGSILISAKQFTRLWPSQEGFRAFVADVPPAEVTASIKALTEKFDRDGMDVMPAVERLELFHAVEGTYLNMFLVLGGIGLLLGASATGIVVLRNLLERRRELALLQALGFSRAAVLRLLGYEYGFVLLLGAGIGSVSSIVAMLPALGASHGDASVLWRLGAFLLVMLGAGLCAAAALLAGLRNTEVSTLNAE